MKKAIALSIVITLVITLSIVWTALYVLRAPWKPRPEGTPTPAPTGEGWIDLLSEEHRPHWRNITDDTEIFGFEDDMLHIYGKSITPLRYVGYAAEHFGDFELHLEFKLTRRANSGVFLRVQENDPVRRGFEVQVLEDHGRPPSYTSSGSVYDVVSPMFNMSKPAGEWNSFDISLRGHHIVVYKNGWKIIDADMSKMTMPIGKFPIPFAELPMVGLIALQDHGGEAWFRNIYVRPITAEETVEQEIPAPEDDQEDTETASEEEAPNGAA